MKVQMRVVHVQTGRVWLTEAGDATQAEIDEMSAAIKETIAQLTFIEIDGDILPGDFIRQQCVIRFIFPQE